MSQQDSMTILFADVCRSTTIFEEYGDRKAREIISHTLSAMTQVANKHGGQLIKTIGDEIMCTLPSGTAGVLAACDMQRRVTSDLQLVRYNVSVRIGLHFGDVLQENDDVFGDAVNVAARMAGIAKAQQVVTTTSTAQDLSEDHNLEIRSLGKTRVKGKLMPIEIVDVLWQDDTSNVTTVSQALNIEEIQDRASLTIHYGDKTIEIRDVSPPFMMGRDPANDLVVDDEWVSRVHASLEYRKGYFVLVDRSTNGTYLTTDNDQEFRVHQDEVHLRRQGVISLGQTAANRTPDGLVRFECHNS
ncbi:MAG: adenylate/guanylate cyclase domain-containing protein [Xanthomonadales bacterium]|nr:adenylate/guanylate cyclase domain-containing protein [Xanthomonadales bacterium]